MKKEKSEGKYRIIEEGHFRWGKAYVVEEKKKMLLWTYWDKVGIDGTETLYTMFKSLKDAKKFVEVLKKQDNPKIIKEY